MTKSASIFCSAAIAALIGATAVSGIANGAQESTPEEKAATEALNRKIADGNAAEEAREKAAKADYAQKMKQYEDEKRAYEQKKAEYDAQVRLLQGPP